MILWCQFFLGEDGKGSMRNLLMFLSFWFASYVLIYNRDSVEIVSIYAIYLSTFTTLSLGGKTLDWLKGRNAKSLKPGK